MVINKSWEEGGRDLFTLDGQKPEMFIYLCHQWGVLGSWRLFHWNGRVEAIRCVNNPSHQDGYSGVGALAFLIVAQDFRADV